MPVFAWEVRSDKSALKRTLRFLFLGGFWHDKPGGYREIRDDISINRRPHLDGMTADPRSEHLDGPGVYRQRRTLELR